VVIITGWSLLSSYPEIITAFFFSVPDFDVYKERFRIFAS
jgi:hypothetical protein